MATIIDGKAFAAKLREKVKVLSDELKASHNVTPGLAVVIVGEDPASQVYVRSKGKQATEVGFNSYEHKLPETTSRDELVELIDNLNADDNVHGILVQLPLPKHIGEEEIINRIDASKDVDADVNPYIAIAATLACGYLGMIEGLKPTEEERGNAYILDRNLPQHLSVALSEFEENEKVREILGDRFVDLVCTVKRDELNTYDKVISSWEREHLLLNV